MGLLLDKKDNLVEQLGPFLEEKYELYHRPKFIETDPVQIPHRFTVKEDIEISAFLTSTISWGQRPSIIKNAWKLMGIMSYSPYRFLMEEGLSDSSFLDGFVHRTFNSQDCFFFLKSLKNIYLNHGGLEKVFADGFRNTGTIFGTIAYFRRIFLELPHEPRVCKHVSDVERGASAKRINMFLRWMVRNDPKKIDFGFWTKIPVSSLMLPLDVHTGNVSRALGLLTRRSNDWKAVEEVTLNLRSFDPFDPVRFDYALFGSGVFGDPFTKNL